MSNAVLNDLDLSFKDQTVSFCYFDKYRLEKNATFILPTDGKSSICHRMVPQTAAVAALALTAAVAALALTAAVAALALTAAVAALAPVTSAEAAAVRSVRMLLQIIASRNHFAPGHR